MTWEKKRVLLAVKAYPERSSTYGDVVCTAGVTDEGEWIRLYPIDFQSFRGYHRLKRYTVIECECKPARKEKLGRKESYRVRDNSIRVIHTDYVKPVDWGARMDWIMPLKADSLEDLNERYEEDRTSLGLIKPKEVLEFHHEGQIRTDLHRSKQFQITIDGEKVPIVTSIPHQFKYRFICHGCTSEHGHNIQCEDWELLESYRSWGRKYSEPEDLWDHLHTKYFDFMVKERNLHFYMGMYSQQPTWLIIGIFYPPRIEKSSESIQQTTLNENFK